jgi:hypothetical protein
MISEPWKASGSLEVDLSKRPIDNQIQRILTFIKEHDTSLQSIEPTNYDLKMETPFRPISIAVDPAERVAVQDLINTHSNDETDGDGDGSEKQRTDSSESLRKVMIVLVYLCDEIHGLKEMAEGRFFTALVMFGRSPIEIDKKDGEILESSQETNKAGIKEIMMGSFVSTLQEISNFINHCRTISVNLVQQLSSIVKITKSIKKNEGFYGLSNLLGPKKVSKSENLLLNTHLLSVFSALGSLLSILVTFDSIIKENGFLKESWGLYKDVICYARADPASFNSTEEGLQSFEKMIVALDRTLMRGEIFKGCIEQDFEATGHQEHEGFEGDGEEKEERISVNDNKPFLKELLHCLQAILENALRELDTNNELFERREIVGSYCLYALYSRLLPRNAPPDQKLFRNLWSVQKVIPSVLLYQNILLNIDDFLLTEAPTKIDKALDPPDSIAYRRSFILNFDSTLGANTGAIISQCNAWFVLSHSKLQPSLK